MGERKRLEVFTTFSGRRSTVIESSFSGTILEMIQMPFFWKNYFRGKRGECGYSSGS
jgi:hypothetical protein